MAEEEDIETTKIRLAGNIYIKLGKLITVVIAIVSVIYAYVYKELDTSNTLEDLQSSQKTSETRIMGLEKEIIEKKSEIERLSKKAPIPYLPARDSAMIIIDDFGEVELHWYERQQLEEDTKYKIIYYPSNSNGIPKFIDVPRPEEKKVTIYREDFGIFFWKVGDETNDRWSDYVSFSVYKSTLDRILATRRLIVGRTADFNLFDDGVIGFEDKLVNWLAEHLEDEFSIPNITVERKVLKWGQLLKAVQEGDVDIALANITKSKKREQNYFPLTFSVGYLANHQVLLHKKNNNYPPFPDGLRGKVVGAHAGSINLKAASSISGKYGFTIYDDARAYADSIDALEKNKIDFAMIDMVRYLESETRLKAKVKCYGPKGKDFDKILEPFYMEEFKQSREEIAIAVHDLHPDTADKTLLKVINNMLSSEEGKLKLKNIKKKYFPNFKHPCE